MVVVFLTNIAKDPLFMSTESISRGKTSCARYGGQVLRNSDGSYHRAYGYLGPHSVR